MGIRYPDNGHPFEDAGVLRNAVVFTTSQRAFTALSILAFDLDHLDEPNRAFLAINAFTAQMMSYEDVITWTLVLDAWDPGTFDTSLMRLLDHVELNQQTEERAERLLASLDEEGMRRFFHIPKDHEMRNELLPEALVVKLATAMGPNLEGLRNIVASRRQNDRIRVFAYNKIKHVLLAFPAGGPNGSHVLIPKLRWRDDTRTELSLAGLEISSEPHQIRLAASRAVIAQAVLNSLLSTILWIRFGEHRDPPQWAIGAMDLPGWRDGDPP